MIEAPSAMLVGLRHKYHMLWDRLTRTVAPTTEIVTLEEAKDHLRVDGDDAAVARSISAAIAMIDGPGGIGVPLITQTWRLSLDCNHLCVRIPLAPLQSLTSVEYRSGTDWITVDPSLYHVDADANPATVHFRTCLPFEYPGDIRITFVCGYGDDAADVPADLRHLVLLLVGHLYENREATVAGSMSELPMGAAAIMDRYRAVPIA